MKYPYRFVFTMGFTFLVGGCALDSPRPGATHQIGAEGETTQTWLIFKEDKLQSIQLMWTYRLKRLATAQRVELCQG